MNQKLSSLAIEAVKAFLLKVKTFENGAPSVPASEEARKKFIHSHSFYYKDEQLELIFTINCVEKAICIHKSIKFDNNLITIQALKKLSKITH